MAPKKQAYCAAQDCGKVFLPRIKTQRFCSPVCKNREAQRRYQARQRKGATA